MAGKKAFVIFNEAKQRGFYDEYPMLPGKEVDLQLHLSRNDKIQPFFLICEKDTVLSQISGEATVEFRDSSVLTFSMSIGDYVYVPARTPHRIVPKTESIHLRYKPSEPSLEAVAWYCESCNEELTRVEWDNNEEISQDMFLKATSAFNDDPQMRTCPSCKHVSPTVDIAGNQWATIADEIRLAGSVIHHGFEARS